MTRDGFGIVYPLETGQGDGWTVETFATEAEASAAVARVLNTTDAEYVTMQERRGGVWREPYATFTRDTWREVQALD